jgi:glycosyltransferase involved in cell wall biosynthesis
MRIAMLAPPWYAVPPAAYGGVEMLVAGLADGLVARGHEVLLVSAGRNGTLAAGVTTLAMPADDRLGDEVTSLLHAALAEDAVRSFPRDVVHDHTLPGLLAARHRTCPTVATVHGPPVGEYGELLGASGHVRLVAISRSQRRGAPELPWNGLVHNGIPVRSYPFTTVKEDFLLFLGRMHPDKGVLQAIEVAERSGFSLLIAARMHGREEERFFAEQVRPRLSTTIEFVGEVGFVEKGRLLSQARALLFPLQWEEPYGLVVAEAQACGTPVVSLRRGAVPELVVDGRTGILRDHHLDLVDAVDLLPGLDPRDCREHALAVLDIERTVRGYETVFADAVEAATARPSRRQLPGAARTSTIEPAPVGRIHATTDQTVRVTSLLTKESS